MPNQIPEEIRDYLECNEDGVLVWKRSPADRIPVGSKAGAFNKTNGYIRVGFRKKLYSAHRVAFFLAYGWAPSSIDHINGIQTDNRPENLREANPSVNSKNRTLNINNRSGFTGVVWNKKGKKWHAQIRVDGKYIYLGSFKSKRKAIDERLKANKIYGFSDYHGLSIEKRNKERRQL